MQTLEKKFFSLLLREQILLLLFVLIIFAVWASSLVTKWSEARTDYRRSNQSLSFQKMVLAEESNIEKQLVELQQKFDQSKTLSLFKLSERIESLTRQAEVGGDVTRPNTEKGEVFNVNTVEVLIKSKKIGKIMVFTQLLKDQSPYISINDLKITPQKSNPNLLDARFRVSSLELNQAF